jgi:hypothetical protein
MRGCSGERTGPLPGDACLRRRLVAPSLLAAALAAAAPGAAGQAEPPPAFGPGVAGVADAGFVVATGVPLTSGPWGTDYITVSHALRVGAQFAVLRDGFPDAETRSVAACSSQAHGIDVLILRARTHPNSAVVEWGDPAALRPGDEFYGFPRREIHPAPVKYRFVHMNYLEWSRLDRHRVSHQWHNTLVALGTSRPGFSGSPWVAGGKVFGLHKGSTRLPGGPEHQLGESARRIAQCLEVLGYEHLIPQN